MSAPLTTAEVAAALSDPTSPHYLCPAERDRVGAYASGPSFDDAGAEIRSAVAKVLGQRGTR